MVVSTGEIQPRMSNTTLASAVPVANPARQTEGKSLIAEAAITSGIEGRPPAKHTCASVAYLSRVS